jgi:hypothetical protein
MLAEGRRIDKRRNDNNKNTCNGKSYPPMDTHSQAYRLERYNQNILDTTFHVTSHMLEEALSLPNVDSTNNQEHVSNHVIFITKGVLNEELADSFKHQSYKSIDVSNIENTDSNYEKYNAYLLCFNISTKCSHLQSLCLHNCKIHDACVKDLASILKSQENVLKSLDLSKNKITDVGAKALRDVMKSPHCILEELDLSHNHLTLAGLSHFAMDLSNLLRVKALRLADSEQLVPLSIYQQFSTAIEKNVVLQTLTLGSEIMDCSRAESKGDNSIEKKQRIDDALLCFWHEPQYTAVTDHIRMLLLQNSTGIRDLLCSSRVDVTSIRNALDNSQPEREVDACFRLLRLRPDILLAATF